MAVAELKAATVMAMRWRLWRDNGDSYGDDDDNDDDDNDDDDGDDDDDDVDDDNNNYSTN